MKWASITEPWFVNANRANYKTYTTISILQSCGKPFITETKGSNSGNTTQIWHWCPEPELSADSGEISFALGTTKYSKVKITPGIHMPELPWLISKTPLTLPECFLETSECRERESFFAHVPWPAVGAKQGHMSEGQGDQSKAMRSL